MEDENSERSDAADDRHKDDGRGPFEKFVEGTNQIVSRAPFFLVILGVVALWLVSFPMWHDAEEWQIVIHTIASVLSLLLLVLLENAGRRSSETAQEKLNVLAEALSDLMESRSREDPELEDAVRRLREAVGLEERH